jgi:hypothetical protein
MSLWGLLKAKPKPNALLAEAVVSYLEAARGNGSFRLKYHFVPARNEFRIELNTSPAAPTQWGRLLLASPALLSTYQSGNLVLKAQDFPNWDDFLAAVVQNTLQGRGYIRTNASSATYK